LIQKRDGYGLNIRGIYLPIPKKNGIMKIIVMLEYPASINNGTIKALNTNSSKRGAYDYIEYLYKYKIT
jgi:hypothetical protein